MVWELVTLDELYAYKERTGLSWVAIGKKLGVTHGAVYCWRVGRTVAPPETQALMATLFREGVVEDLLLDTLEGAALCFVVDARSSPWLERLLSALRIAVQGEGRA